MPLTVKNPLSNPVIYSRKGEEDIIWDAAGDPSGGDVQEVGDEFAGRNDFLTSVKRGVLVVIGGDDEDVVARVRRVAPGSTQFVEAEGATAQEVLDSFDSRPDRSVVSMKCVGPAQRGEGTCGTNVMVAPQFAKEYPPLCPPHGPLLGQFERNATGEWVMKKTAPAKAGD